MQWKVGVTDITMRNPSGAPDVGSTTHCVHGRHAFDQEILDWRPFDYFSHREVGPYGSFLWTFALTGSESTQLEVRVKLLGGMRQRAMMLVGRRKLGRIIETGLANMSALVEQQP